MSDFDILAVSDLHFTSKSDDQARFNIFEQLEELIHKHGIKQLIVPGDLTTAKNNHSADLVNRVVQGFWYLELELASNHDKYLAQDRIIILQGNHDLVGEGAIPYFQFLDKYDGIRYVDKPTYLPMEDDRRMLFLPHTKNPLNDWGEFSMSNCIVFTHVTVNGAITESGFKLESNIDSKYFDDALITFSGDIHKPQEVGGLIYIGAPYHTRFGDNYEGGCILFNSQTLEWERVLLDFPQKVVFDITCIEDLSVATKRFDTQDRKGKSPAQVKIRLHLNQSNIGSWQTTKNDCRDFFSKRDDFQLCAFELIRDIKEVARVQKSVNTPEQQVLSFDKFCEQQKITRELLEVGKQIIKETVL